MRFNHVTTRNLQSSAPTRSILRGGRPASRGFTLRNWSDHQLNHAALCSDNMFAQLRGEDVILVADDANLRISFEEQVGAPLDYARLRAALVRASRSIDTHLVVTCITREQHERARTLNVLGYQVHRIPHPNVDTAIGYTLGQIAEHPRSSRTLWMLATGDGELGLCLAGALSATFHNPRIATLSVRHSTAIALRQCPLIGRNLYLTADLASTLGNTEKERDHV